MRADVSFESGGISCRGWFYCPGNISHPAPAIVMSHGITAVKEQYLDDFAQRFAAEGFAVLVFDYRHLGASDGTPRGKIDPSLQQDDVRAALTWVAKQPGVDPARLALWGSSFSGGHALFVGALDPRVRVIVAQVPALDIPRSLIGLLGRDGFNGLLGSLSDDFTARTAGAAGAVIPVVAPPGEMAFLGTPDAFKWFTESAKAVAPQWLNQISLESIALSLIHI